MDNQQADSPAAENQNIVLRLATGLSENVFTDLLCKSNEHLWILMTTKLKVVFKYNSTILYFTGVYF